MANLDWHSVYREERRRPACVLEDGRSLIPTDGSEAMARTLKTLLTDEGKRKAHRKLV